MGNRSFNWKALDQDGRVIRGIWEFKHASEVRSQLFSQGYYPLEIRLNKQILHSVGSFMDRVNKKSDSLRIWAGIAKRLSLLLQAGIPLVTAIEILGETDKKARFSSFAWDLVKEQIEAGVELSEALQALHPSPTPFIRAMIRAGEQAGTLPEVLAQISVDFEEEYLFRRKLVGAYSYPLFLFLLAFGVIYALSVMVLPVYERIFMSLDSELPILTQVIFSFSRSLPWMMMTILLILMGLFLAIRVRYPKIWREKVSDLISRVPILGRIYRLNDWFQFTRVLATLLEAGIPLMEALNLTSGTVRHYEMKKMIAYLGNAAREGKRLAPVLRLSREFPIEASQMLAVGEESGQLCEMLHSMAKMFHMDLEEQMETLPRILGPVLIIIISAIVGAVAVGVLLPIFDVGTHLD